LSLIYGSSFLGLVAAIFLSFSVLSGIFALLPQSYKKYVPPIYVKCAHNLFAIITFVSGFTSIIIAYNTRNFVRYVDPGNMRYFMLGFLSTILVITLLGPLKSFLRNFKILFLSSPSEIVEINRDHRSSNYNTTNCNEL
jgi:Eukaryotic cytochrome b561